jgi:hypothetical protein
MQKAVQNMAGTQPKASSQVREALGDLQQSETKLRMKRSTDWIRRGQGQYLMGSEQAATGNLERLRDQLRQAQQALDPNARPGAGDKDQQQAGGPGGKQQGDRQMEQALERVERMRSQLQQLMRNGQQNGQQQQGGQQPGQQQGQNGQLQRGGQQQGGQQAGNQQGGQQQGGQQQGGQQQGGQQPGGQQGGQQQGNGQQQGGQQMGGSTGGGPWNGGGVWNNGRTLGDVSPERALREASRDLAQLRQAMRDNPELQREFGEAFQELQRMDFSRLPQGPELEERLRRQVMPNIESLELLLRRKLEEARGGQVRNASSERPPDGYAEKVADYFRRLSKGK